MIEGTAPSSGRAEALGAGEDKPHFGVIHFGEFPGGDHGRALPVGATRSQLECQSPRPFGGLWGATSVAVLSMSDGELRRLEVLRDVDRGGLPVGAAARLLAAGVRK